MDDHIHKQKLWVFGETRCRQNHVNVGIKLHI